MLVEIGKMQTEYGRAVCEVLAAQVTWLLGRKLRGKDEAAAIDLVEIKRTLARVRLGIGGRTERKGTR